MKIYIAENCKDIAQAKSAILRAYAPHNNCSIKYSATGQPSLCCENEKIACASISHTGNIIVMVVSIKPVGVDVERNDRKISSRLGGISEWTRREAYGKMIGVGINSEILRSELPDDMLNTFEYSDYIISICSQERELELITTIDI